MSSVTKIPASCFLLPPHPRHRPDGRDQPYRKFIFYRNRRERSHVTPNIAFKKEKKKGKIMNLREINCTSFFLSLLQIKSVNHNISLHQTIATSDLCSSITYQTPTKRGHLPSTDKNCFNSKIVIKSLEKGIINSYTCRTTQHILIHSHFYKDPKFVS